MKHKRLDRREEEQVTHDFVGHNTVFGFILNIGKPWEGLKKKKDYIRFIFLNYQLDFQSFL